MGSSCPALHGSNPLPLLTNAPAKQLVMFGEGTHNIYLEKNRMQLFNEVQNFLEEKLNGGRS
jgi:esterase/lipase